MTGILPEDKVILTEQEVADFLGKSIRSYRDLRRLDDRGELTGGGTLVPPFFRVGRDRRYPRKLLEAWVESRCGHSDSGDAS